MLGKITSLAILSKRQSWWFHEYESDPTIQSMLVALDKMAELLKDKKF